MIFSILSALVFGLLQASHVWARNNTSTDAVKCLVDCLTCHLIPYVTSKSANWMEYAATFNVRVPYEPEAIALPITVKHISDAVLCAKENGINVQAKSGGHSYASFSTDAGLEIDLENFKEIELDDSTNIVKVGSGARIGNLALQIWEQNKRAIAHGTCPGVGVGGHATHGGYGYSSRAWGLALDQIIALDVVLANGSFVYATNTSFPEVYYAMRGAGDAFGIATTFYFETQPAPETVIYFNYQFPGVFSGGTDAVVSAFAHVQAFAQNASVIDRNIGFGMGFGGNTTAGSLVFSVFGTYFGSLADFNSSIAPPLLADLPEPGTTHLQAVDWEESLVILAGSNLSQPLHGYDSHSNFYAKSVTLPEPVGFPDNVVETYADYVLAANTNPPNVNWFAIINLYGGPDSQINNKDISFAGYSDRDALWVIQHYGYVENDTEFPADGLTFVDGLNDAVTKNLTEYGAYLNYVDPEYTKEEAHSLYYSAELYARLVTLKAEIDPTNVFSNPQSIP